MTGPYWWAYWALILCNVVVADTLCGRSASARASPCLFCVSLVVSVGMWLERFVIIVTSLHRDFLPSSWGIYRGTTFDWAMFIGTIGLFLTLLLPVHPLPARDLDLRDADARARGEARRGGGAHEPPGALRAAWPSSTRPPRS